MIHLVSSALFLAFSAISSVQARYVFYYDQYHQDAPNRTITAGIDHVIIAFANSSLFTTDPPGKYVPFKNISSIRSLFDDGTKLSIAIGGWADTIGFGIGAETEESRKLFAKNVKAMIDEHDCDGVDFDWEYPGGNGQDYRQRPNSEKVSEIETYPLLLEETRLAIGPEKLLTIATPARRPDMIAYTPDKAPSIWKSVDWVNVMTYDIMNRRDNITVHHTDIKGSLDVIDYYINELKLEPAKINLGHAMYAKWFTVKSNDTCETGLGCETVPLEAPDGSDTGKSGTVTFEASNFVEPPTNMTESANGLCGATAGTFCPEGNCCSAFGFCGNTDEFCNACQGPEYGSGCKKTGINTLFQRAMKNGITDEVAGAQYYYERKESIFWTWDTAKLMDRKFTDIVESRKLGGVFAWSIGQDSYDYSRILALQKNMKKTVGDSDSPIHGIKAGTGNLRVETWMFLLSLGTIMAYLH